jgi:hypothetical protein
MDNIENTTVDKIHEYEHFCETNKKIRRILLDVMYRIVAVPLALAFLCFVLFFGAYFIGIFLLSVYAIFGHSDPGNTNLLLVPRTRAQGALCLLMFIPFFLGHGRNIYGRTKILDRNDTMGLSSSQEMIFD